MHPTITIKNILQIVVITIILGSKKNIHINAPIFNKHFGTKSCLNRAITLCRNLQININKFPNFIYFKRFIILSIF